MLRGSFHAPLTPSGGLCFGLVLHFTVFGVVVESLSKPSQMQPIVLNIVVIVSAAVVGMKRERETKRFILGIAQQPADAITLGPILP